MAPSASVKSFQVDLVAVPNAMKITPEPVTSFAPEFISYQSIKSITPIYEDLTANLGAVFAAVTGYTSTPDTISIGGDYAANILPGSSVTIAGSTNNDGTWTVVSAIFDGTNTIITVSTVGVIVAAPVDGTLSFVAPGTVENNQAGEGFRETYPYPRITVLAIELWDDSIVRLELQSITNQPTWSTGDLAGLSTASAAVAAQL